MPDAIIDTRTAILGRAADVIVERGWHRGDNVDPNGTGVCAIGAIKVALGLDPADGLISADKQTRDVYLETVRMVEKHIGGCWLNVWNDDVAESAEQVVTVLRQAALTLDKPGEETP